MYLSEKELITSRNIIGFTVPVLHKGKEWYVGFMAFDPVSGKMKRKKYMLNKYKKTGQREAMASILIHNLFDKLKCGWSPFADVEKTRQFTPFQTIIDRYRGYIQVMSDKCAMKEKTAFDYKSRLKVLAEYISEYRQVKYVYQFDRTLIIDFLDYIFYDRDVSATTRNNYRTWLSTFGTWLVERKFLDENPAEGIKAIAQKEKFRDALTPDALKRLHAYLYENNKHFLLACLMEYYTFVRPDELAHIRIRDISVKNQTVFVSSAISKNRKDGLVALNDKILKLMIELHTFDKPGHCFLFGKKMCPDESKGTYNQFRNEWGKVRKALSFPDSYQFYSLKDSGIRDLANAEGIVVARDQARHSDVSVTNRYLKGSKKVDERTKHFKGNL